MGGGIPPFRYGLAGGGLPKGMALLDAGLLVGVPDAPAGEYRFTAAATDATGATTALDLVFTARATDSNGVERVHRYSLVVR